MPFIFIIGGIRGRLSEKPAHSAPPHSEGYTVRLQADPGAISSGFCRIPQDPKKPLIPGMDSSFFADFLL
jgi:hypothetical protein